MAKSSPKASSAKSNASSKATKPGSRQSSLKKTTAKKSTKAANSRSKVSVKSVKKTTAKPIRARQTKAKGKLAALKRFRVTAFTKTKRVIRAQVRLITIGILAIAALAYVLTLNNGNASGYGPSTILIGKQDQTQEAPSRITTYGPAQSDNQFSTYPTWSQDFAHYKSNKLNSNYWRINIGAPNNGNNEAEYYTNDPSNLRISQGSLILEATHQAEPNNYQYGSGRVDTKGKLSFRYGRIDVTAKLPIGVGTWPAIWLLPANTKYEDMSPPSDIYRFLNGGEIDMAEAVGFNPNLVYGVVHTVTSNENNPNGVGDYNQVLVANNNLNYNTYTLLWTPDSITFEVNNKPYYTYYKQPGATYLTWPFNQPFYLIIDLAVGGVWGGEDTAQYPNNGINNAALPASLQIKSIYYYPYIANKPR